MFTTTSTTTIITQFTGAVQKWHRPENKLKIWHFLLKPNVLAAVNRDMPQQNISNKILQPLTVGLLANTDQPVQWL